MDYATDVESAAALAGARAAAGIAAKVAWRLLPVLVFCYFTSYLDRVNVGFAKLQMLGDLHFSETVYGLGAGIFFIGYAVCQIPANIILHRMGARLWIASIMIAWGVVSGAMVFVRSETSFYALRFLLGATEAGFFPGIILYLTYWFPAARRAKMTALFMAGIPLSGIIGGPISGWIMQDLSGAHGYAGWQWLFLLEAIPAILMGILVIFILHDRIADAPWLSEPEKRQLESEIAAEAAAKETASFGAALANPRVWQAAGIYFCFVMAVYGISFWLPTIIRETGVRGPLNIGLLTAIPYTAAVVGMVIFAYSADRMRERRWHVVTAALLGAAGLVASVIFSHDTALALAALSVATLGIISGQPVFWSLPTAFLSGVAAAAGIALINAVGNIAGFVSPYMIGWLTDLTKSTNTGMYILAAIMLVGIALVLALPARLVNK